jgi:hypothetical protein
MKKNYFPEGPGTIFRNGGAARRGGQNAGTRPAAILTIRKPKWGVFKGLVFLAVSCPLLWNPAMPLCAGQASGKFIAAGKSIAPKFATAYEVRDQSNGRERSVEIMLASAALDLAEIASALDPHVVAINSEPATGNYILLWAKADGRLSMNATFPETMTQYLDDTSGALKVEWTENTPRRLSGRVWTANPVKTMSGEAWSVDVKFATDVVRPPAGTKLAVDGGTPGRTLEALYRAVEKKDWPGIKAGIAPARMGSLERDDNTPAENLKEAVETLGSYWLPKKYKITGGEQRGEIAILEVEGELYPGAKWLFLVQMVKGAPGWQYENKVPAGKLN